MAVNHMKYLAILEKIAEDVEPVRSSKHSAAIVLKNNIISVGTNKIKTSPFQLRFAKNPAAIYLHAETCAICRAIKNISLDDLSRSTLYVLRVKKDRDAGKFVWGNSKPCDGCMTCISEFNINKLVYTIDGTGKNFEERLNRSLN
jgi:deoxycytidylate deaminase